MIQKILTAIHEYFWAVIISSFFFAFLFPEISGFFTGKVTGMLIFIMTLSCINIDFSSIVKIIQQPGKILGILAIIHVLPPLLILPLREYLTAEQFLGMVILSAISSAVSVVFLSRLFGGNINTAVIVVSLSTLLNPILLPLAAWYCADSTIPVDYNKMIHTIFLLIVLPLIIGQIIKYSPLKDKALHLSSSVSTLMLFLIIAGIIAPTRHQILNNPHDTLKIFAISSFIAIASFIAGFMYGKTKEEKITCSLAAGFKNFGLATVLILNVFGETVALAPVVYTIAGNLLLAPFHMIVSKYKRRQHE